MIEGLKMDGGVSGQPQSVRAVIRTLTLGKIFPQGSSNLQGMDTGLPLPEPPVISLGVPPPQQQVSVCRAAATCRAWTLGCLCCQSRLSSALVCSSSW